MNKNSNPPVITILGHVDHGKTTLLDTIRKSSVAATEAGGITQKISVFSVDTGNGKIKTFVDTPGHEAFGNMRRRGGEVADIVLLIISADDGIMPQTKESIEIIKESKLIPIVVITKVDILRDSIDTIKRELSYTGLLVEGYGGDVPVVEVSAITGEGIDKLLELIDIVWEMNSEKNSKDILGFNYGKVVESFKDKHLGNCSIFIMTEGTATKADRIAYRDENGCIFSDSIKVFLGLDGKRTDSISSGEGSTVTGVSKLIEPNSIIMFYTKDEKNFKESLSKLEESLGVEFKESVSCETNTITKTEFGTIEELSELLDPGKDQKKVLHLLLKASSQGALEAMEGVISKLGSEMVDLNIVKATVGDIVASDLEVARVKRCIVLGFDVNISGSVKELFKKAKVPAKTYKILYEIVDDVKDLVESMELGKEIEEDLGSAIVKQIFTLSNGTKVIGARVKEGLFKKNEKIHLVRADELIASGRCVSLKINKSEVKEVTNGNDFGAIIEFNEKAVEVLEGDELYCYKIVKD